MKHAIMIMLAFAGVTTFAFQTQGRGSLNGVTLDLDGNPVPNVELVVTNINNPSDVRTATSNEDGKFTLRSMMGGMYEITATKEGYRSQPMRYNQRAMGPTAVDFLMVAEGASLDGLGEQAKISGKVIDTQGNPLEDVTINFTTELFPQYKQTVTTDANGEFSGVPGVNRSIVQAYLKKEDYRDVIHQFSMEAEDITIDTLTMQTLDEAYAELGIKNPKKTPEDQAIELYNQAVTPFQNKDWEVAERLAREALELNTDLDQAVKMLAYTNYNSQDWKEAVFYANQLLEKTPEDKDIMMLAMDAAVRAKDNQTIAKLNKKMEDMGMVDAESVYNQAVEALNANDDERGKALLEKVLDMNDKFADAYYHMGMILIREAEFESAVSNLKLFLKHAPENDKKRQEATDLIITLSE